MTRLNEKEIIGLFSSRLRINEMIKNENDDVVILPLEKIIKQFKNRSSVLIVLKSDMLVESTDVPPRMRPWQIARKSVVSCVSDMSAKGINPPYLCLISIGIPSRYSKGQIVELVNGFQMASKEFGVKIVGGDTNKSDELVINCNLVGALPRDTRVPKRNGAKPGDIVVSSGEFGFSSCGLKILINNAIAKWHFRRIAIQSVMKPEPAQRFGTSMAKFFSSSIDSSDGLAASLYELARQSEVNLIIENAPSAKGIQQFAIDNGLAARDLIFYGGEEYEIIATISKVNLERVRSLTRKLKLKLYVIGRVEKGNGKVIILSESGRQLRLMDRGYLHRFVC
ncbi:MAG: thiamine-phosphate kinase [Nitrososphaeraceae archaeon]